MKKTYRIIILSVFLFILSFASVFAFQKIKTEMTANNNFIVEPGKTEIYINPGETITKNISIINRIGKNVEFKLTTEDITGSNDPETPVKLLGDETGPYSIKNFIKPEITNFSLDLGERINIPVTISIPKDAEPRGYYGALIVSNAPSVLGGDKTKEKEGKARIISRIGSLFLVRINGEGKELGRLKDFKIIGPSKTFYQNRPKGFEIEFRNDGNVHLVPYGMITIKNMLGTKVGSIPVDAYFSLPNATRYREVLWQKGIALGRYTAHISLYKGYGNTNEEASISFWVIPWKILIASFIGLIFLVSIFYYILTRFEIKKKNK